MVIEAAIDTLILQKANAPITPGNKEGVQFKKRLAILTQISKGEIRVLISNRLMGEYRIKVPEPRNDFVRALFELLTTKDVTWNYATWGANRRGRARRCAYPKEDDHVLRTAIKTMKKTYLLTEENRILRTAECVNREFDVLILDPRND